MWTEVIINTELIMTILETARHFIADFLRDARLGFRVLRKSPGFALVAILTLALGIGANTAIFSIVDGVLLKPLPFFEPSRLVTLWERHPVKGIVQENVSPPDFADWSAQQRVFQRMAYWTGPAESNFVGEDGTEKVRASYASSDLFPTLGVTPILGRTFTADEDLREGNKVAVLGYEFWQRRFSGDTNVIGKTITIDTFGKRDYTIVGVLPRGFRFPDDTELWLPSGWNGLSRDRRGGHWLTVIARLKDGASLEAVAAEMNTIQGGIAQQFPDVVIGTHVVVLPLLEHTLGFRLRSALLVLLAIVACVLLIACANVANLALARAAARQRELAVRLAVGASRLRLVRQLMTESLLLAFIGGVAGVLLAIVIVRLIIFFNAGHVPRLEEAHVDARVLLFTLVVSLATGLLAGLAPAWQFTRPDLNSALKGEGGIGNLNRGRLRGVLVVAQLSLALILVVGAGLMTRSLLSLVRLDHGFDRSRLVTARIDYSVHGFTTWVQPTATRPQVKLREFLERLRSSPGVQYAGATGGLPGGQGAMRPFSLAIENRATAPGSLPVTANFQGITPDYFRAMAIPQLQGRQFDESDQLESKAVAIVNDAFVKRYFPGENPIGKRIAMFGRNPGELSNNPFSDSPWTEIVGVVGDVRRLTLEATLVPDVFRPYWQWPMQTPTLVVRENTGGAGVATAIRSELRAVSPNVPVPRVRTMDDLLSDVVAQPRFYTVLSALFGGVAVLLAVIGIYGVMACSVEQRRKEIGIRVALGAAPSGIARLILGGGMKLTIIGIGIGLVVAAMLTRVLRSLLFGIDPLDPLTYVLAGAVMVAASLAACIAPAYRAVRADPLIAIRHE
jgi:predicted permease